MPSSTADARESILAEAAALGFDLVRIAPPSMVGEAGVHLSQFLAEGRHGSMHWMAREPARRAAPNALWPEARSIIVVGTNYAPVGDPLENLTKPSCGSISVYARGDDYHDVMKAKLKLLANFVQSRFGAEVKLFVDTAPVMEKPLAERAGLGWQGKHTNLVSREFGSWLFLGSLFTTLALEPDEAEADHCGQCRRCLEACPTAALTAPYRIDARRCISYLTIEHKDHIPAEFRPALGNRIYGCDDCLAVCPWNKFAQIARESRFHARRELNGPSLENLVELDDASFRALFRRSPIKRIGRDRFVRNVLIAIGNSRNENLAAVAARRLEDHSPLVRAMAVWATARLVDNATIRAHAIRLMTGESDDGVLEEWRMALGG